ncbi:MAG TPA: hypothetical protein VGK19_19970 [Capsulimonadaceae bacterium]|jgi:hypothetical protein
MVVNLKPDVEEAIRQQAEIQGLSVEELLARTFRPVDTESRLITHLRALQAEYGMPAIESGKHCTSLTELMRAWDAEDSAMSDEERDAATRLWNDIRSSKAGVDI